MLTFRLLKTIRLRLSDLLSSPDLSDVFVIVLVRDPRGVINSMLNMPDGGFGRHAQADVVCGNILRDVRAAEEADATLGNHRADMTMLTWT